MKSFNPSGMSVKYLEMQGYYVDVVERYLRRTIKKDCFGWADLLAVHPRKEGAVLVQVTDDANFKARLKKARGKAPLRAWLSAGNILLLHGWHENGKLAERQLDMNDLIPKSEKI